MIGDLYLGLDISTSCTGVTCLNAAGEILIFDHIELSKIEGVFSKLEHFKVRFRELIAGLPNPPTHYQVEEPLKVFTPGKSSIATISTLIEFNVLVRNFIRENYGHQCVLISALSARKALGIRLLPPKKCAGKNHKKQTFEQLYGAKGLLNGLDYPKKRTGNPMDFCYDRADSFVVAKALQLAFKENKC